MKISFIELEGFRGVRTRIKVNVPDGFLVITGRNGAGKSTICDAIEYALTGTLSKYEAGTERGESLEHYMWWRGRQTAADHFVRVGFTDRHGKDFVVTRTPTTMEVSDGSELSANLCDINVMTREPLAQICRTAIIRDETIAALSIDLAEADRFTFVRTALGTDALEDVTQRGKVVLAALKRQVDAAAAIYADARNTVSVLVSELSQARAGAADAPDVAGAVEAVAKILGESGALEPSRLLTVARQRIAAIRRANDSMVNVAQDVQSIRERLSHLEGEAQLVRRRELANHIEAVEATVRALELERADLARRSEQFHQPTSLKAGLATLFEIGQELGRRSEACPLCGTKMSAERFAAALATLAQDLAQVEKDAAALRQLSAECERRLAEGRTESARANAELRQAVAEEDELRRRLILLAERARDYLDPSAEGVHAEMIIAGVRREEARLEELSSFVSVLEASVSLDHIADLEKRVALAKDQSSALGERLRELEIAHDRAKRLLAGIRRSVGELVEERLAALDPLLRDLYARLRPHNEWTDLTYRVRGDVKKFLSLNVGGELNPRFTFSSGQRRAIGLAFLLAVHLSRPWCRLKTLVLDDPVQHIDDFRSLHLVEVLGAIRRTGQQIICAVEDEGLAELMCRRLRTASSGEGLLLQMSFRTGEGATMERAGLIPGAIRHLLLQP
jgi:DNA repair exonuclease SbcCD ATPase subunit